MNDLDSPEVTSGSLPPRRALDELTAAFAFGLAVDAPAPSALDWEVVDSDIREEQDATEDVFAHKFTFEAASDDASAIGHTNRESEVEITIRLLSILCNPADVNEHQSDTLLDAMKYTAQHLASIPISKCLTADKVAIIKLLYHLFHDEECLTAFWNISLVTTAVRHDTTSIRNQFLCTKSHTDLFGRWFGEVEDLLHSKWAAFDAEQLRWMHEASLSTRSLLLPLALSAAKYLNTKTLIGERNRITNGVIDLLDFLYYYMNLVCDCLSRSVTASLAPYHRPMPRQRVPTNRSSKSSG
jgi:hypothetical protein